MGQVFVSISSKMAQVYVSIYSFHREYHNQYTDVFRYDQIPVRFDGILEISRCRPIELLNLRVQAVCHPFDERLSFRVLCECGNVMPQEWDLFLTSPCVAKKGRKVIPFVPRCLNSRFYFP